MKYIVNEQNSCGQASLTEKSRNQLLEALGYDIPQKEQIQESVAPEADQTAPEQEENAPALYEWDDAVFSLDDEVFEIEGNLFLKASELDSETRMGLDESHEELFINNVSFDESEYSLGDIYDYGEEIYIKLDEAGKKKTGASKGDEGAGKDKDDKPDFTTRSRKGDKSKTHKGKDFEGDDDNGADLFGKKKVKKEANGEDMSDDEIEGMMNKAAEKKFGKGSTQAKLHKKASKLKKDPDAEAAAAADAKD